MKIRPVGAGLFHADGQTDMNVIVSFRNNCERVLSRTLFRTLLYVRDVTIKPIYSSLLYDSIRTETNCYLSG